MLLSEVQTELLPWQQHNFPDSEPWEPLVGIAEEVGELSHSFLKRHQNIRMNEDHNAKIEDALGDILIYVCDFANRQGVDLDKVLAETWAAVSQRDWRPTQ